MPGEETVVGTEAGAQGHEGDSWDWLHQLRGHTASSGSGRTSQLQAGSSPQGTVLLLQRHPGSVPAWISSQSHLCLPFLPRLACFSLLDLWAPSSAQLSCPSATHLLLPLPPGTPHCLQHGSLSEHLGLSGRPLRPNSQSALAHLTAHIHWPGELRQGWHTAGP